MSEHRTAITFETIPQHVHLQASSVFAARPVVSAECGTSIFTPPRSESEITRGAVYDGGAKPRAASWFTTSMLMRKAGGDAMTSESENAHSLLTIRAYGTISLNIASLRENALEKRENE